MDFKPSQYKEMEVKEDVELLIVPAKGQSDQRAMAATSSTSIRGATMHRAPTVTTRFVRSVGRDSDRQTHEYYRQLETMNMKGTNHGPMKNYQTIAFGPAGFTLLIAGRDQHHCHPGWMLLPVISKAKEKAQIAKAKQKSVLWPPPLLSAPG